VIDRGQGHTDSDIGTRYSELQSSYMRTSIPCASTRPQSERERVSSASSSDVGFHLFLITFPD
jgi:hypothetical protein